MVPLADTLRGAPRILFLCSGNMLRSAFCELLGRQRGLPWELSSAGSRYRNAGLHPQARQALLARGVPASACDRFRPAHLDELPPAAPGTVCLVMTRGHLEDLRRAQSPLGGPDCPAFLCGALLRGTLGGHERGDEIEDPFHTERYDVVFTRLERCLDVLALLGRDREPGRDSAP